MGPGYYNPLAPLEQLTNNPLMFTVDAHGNVIDLGIGKGSANIRMVEQALAGTLPKAKKK